MSGASERAKPDPTRILILGGGFAGAYCALHLQKLLRWRRKLRRRVEVTLVDRHNYLLFYPLLVETGTGNINPLHAVVGLRRFCPAARFIQAEVRDLDLQQRFAEVQVIGEERPTRLDFDHCVLALGSVTLKPPVPGLKEHGYEMKSISDAISLRDRVVQLLEQASAIEDNEHQTRRRELLHLTVVGGSFSGVEVAGEYHEYMREAARMYPRLDPSLVRVTIINRGSGLLEELDPKLGAWALKHLRKRGLEVLLKATATAVHADSVELDDGRRLPARTVVWCAGIEPNPSVKFFEVPTDRHGYVLCEPDLQVQGFENVWGLGDAALNPKLGGGNYAATAQMAVQQGKLCARNIVRVLEDKPTEPAKFREKGALAAFGRGDAVAKVFGLRFTGWFAWWLWRTVYLLKMPGLGRKVRIAADWTLDLFSGRDFVELGVHRTMRPMRRPAHQQPSSRTATADRGKRRRRASLQGAPDGSGVATRL